MRNRTSLGLRRASFSTQILGWALLATVLIGCQAAPPDDLLTKANPTALIFVKTSETNRNGSNLYSLTPISPNGELKNLTNLEEGQVADPEISYDGLKVIFSMRTGSRWHIYEMNVDGTNLRQLTNDPEHDDLDPAYLPNGKILFSSNRPGFRDEYQRRTVEVLHTMNADGSNIERISFNNSDDFDPIVLRDGRIAWTRWEHHGNINKFPLFFTNPDGRSTFLLFGPHNKSIRHPRELEDGNIVAIMDGGIAVLNSTQTTGDPLEDGDYQIIREGDFKYPFPLPDGRLVVSYAPENSGDDYGLYTLNRDGSNLSLLYNDPATEELDAVVVAPRPRPPVIPEQIDRTQNTGVFVNQNVYFRQKRDGQAIPEPNEIKQVMVIEGIPVPPEERNLRIGRTPFERKRILGVAPVYEDGSFSIRVPANTPISLNTLDSLGRAVVIKRNWIYVRPGERFDNCTGCHGPRGQKSNPNPIAVTKEPTDLNIPVEQREVIAFQNALEPIIAAKCVSCHSGQSPAGALDLTLAKTEDYSLAYENLMSSSRRLVNISGPPFSRKSKLIDVLLGIGDREGAGPHPTGENALTPEEIRKFIVWIDLGGQYW